MTFQSYIYQKGCLRAFAQKMKGHSSCPTFLFNRNIHSISPDTRVGFCRSYDVYHVLYFYERSSTYLFIRIYIYLHSFMLIKEIPRNYCKQISICVWHIIHEGLRTSIDMPAFYKDLTSQHIELELMIACSIHVTIILMKRYNWFIYARNLN